MAQGPGRKSQAFAAAFPYLPPSPVFVGFLLLPWMCLSLRSHLGGGFPREAASCCAELSFLTLGSESKKRRQQKNTQEYVAVPLMHGPKLHIGGL